MTKAETIILNARKNPTKRNVAILANLAQKMVESRRNVQRRTRKKLDDASRSQHEYRMALHRSDPRHW